jgi:hypothetical protein
MGFNLEAFLIVVAFHFLLQIPLSQIGSVTGNQSMAIQVRFLVFCLHISATFFIINYLPSALLCRLIAFVLLALAWQLESSLLARKMR